MSYHVQPNIRTYSDQDEFGPHIHSLFIQTQYYPKSYLLLTSMQDLLLILCAFLIFHTVMVCYIKLRNAEVGRVGTIYFS
jgi:hypothetical protein